MRALDVDFAPPVPVLRRPAFWIALILLVCSIVLALQTAWMAHRLAVASSDGEHSAGLLPSPASTSGEVALGPPEGAAEFASWARLDYAAALASIESARVPGVRVVAVDISSADESARIELEMLAVDQLMQFLSDINAGMPEQDRWVLLRWQAGSEGNAGSATLRLKLRQVGR